MLDSLDGLSVGDALGAEFPVMRRSIVDLRAANLPSGPWSWTDDTEMACTLVAELLGHGAVDQDRIAKAFARRFSPHRDHGFVAADVLRRIGDGMHWRQAAGSAFDNRGSYGNGAAMRVAYYAGNPEKAVAQAIRSAQVTHLHPEGTAGAAAVALADCTAAHTGAASATGIPQTWLTAREPCPPGSTRPDPENPQVSAAFASGSANRNRVGRNRISCHRSRRCRCRHWIRRAHPARWWSPGSWWWSACRHRLRS